MSEGSSRGPFIARIHILPTGSHSEIRYGTYRSVAEVDAMLAGAFSRTPPPDDNRRYIQIHYRIHWTDGFIADESAFMNAKGIAEGLRRGGILRHYLWRYARQLSASEYPVIAESGLEFARRLLASSVVPDTYPHNYPHRNIGASPWTGPTLLPDPYASLAGRRERYRRRRTVIAPSEVAASAGSGESASVGYPETTNADVRHVTNWISVALAGDVRQVPDRASAIWNTWRATVDTIEELLRISGPDDAAYVDNEGLWLRQLPRVVAMLADAIAARDSGRRNGRLVFRRVGSVGESYPEWFQRLRDVAGVYVIRERQDDGTTPIVYVGSAQRNLYATISRHLQAWRRSKTFWQGMHGSHDPGLTYARERAEVAVILTTPDDARSVEYDTISALAPRDNLMGQAAAPPDVDGYGDDAVPF